MDDTNVNRLFEQKFQQWGGAPARKLSVSRIGNDYLENLNFMIESMLLETQRRLFLEVQEHIETMAIPREELLLMFQTQRHKFNDSQFYTNPDWLFVMMEMRNCSINHYEDHHTYFGYSFKALPYVHERNIIDVKPEWFSYSGELTRVYNTTFEQYVLENPKTLKIDYSKVKMYSYI
jgi:hypothetical protein